MKFKKDANLVQLDVFFGLCEKAQELIFNALRDEKTCHLLSIVWLDENILQLSPIEQIFYIGNHINNISNRNFFIELEEQKVVYTHKNQYRVDFLVSTYIGKDDCGKTIEYELKNPIVIELDGAEYHSSKKQKNYDYARENNLKLAGYNVVRFTGSQVFNNVFDCLDKVCELIKMSDKEEV